MRLIVGLGNPGAQYARTRHNIGWIVVDAFAARYRITFDGHEKDAATGRGRVAGGSVLLAKPLTFMNLSGSSVAGLVRAHLDAPSDLLVVYDDVDLPLGRLRLRERGSAGTHNGMRSIIETLGTGDFARLRVGIRGEEHGERNLADYVLSDFSPAEEATVDDAVRRSVEALLFFCRGDLRHAMTRVNRDPKPPAEEEAATASNGKDIDGRADDTR